LYEPRPQATGTAFESALGASAAPSPPATAMEDHSTAGGAANPARETQWAASKTGGFPATANENPSAALKALLETCDDVQLRARFREFADMKDGADEPLMSKEALTRALEALHVMRDDTEIKALMSRLGWPRARRPRPQQAANLRLQSRAAISRITTVA